MQTPASNQKLITSAVAAERLGWDYRYTTQIYATGPISPAAISTATSSSSRTAIRRSTRGIRIAGARSMRGRSSSTTKGVRRVSGQLIGDDNAFAEPGWGVGWAWDDLALGYGAAVGALQYNENQVELLIGPGLEAGGRADHQRVAAGQRHHPRSRRHHGRRQEQPSRVSLERIPGSNLLRVSGQVAIGAPAISRDAAVPNPTILYLNALREALARNGIFVGGNSLDIDDARVKPDYQKATLLLEDRSPTLDAVIDVCMKWSRNEYAETLLRSLAPSRRRGHR